MTGKAKTIFLVRHAQSDQNVATHKLCRGDAAALFTLANLGVDAPVSEAGQSQLASARQSLEGLARERNITLVAYSPLQRAVATANAVFGERGVPMVERAEMVERTAAEYLMPSLMDQRIDVLCEWLASREGLSQPLWSSQHCAI